KGEDVARDYAIAADDGMAPDTAELMNAGRGADHGPITDGDMAAHGRRIGQYTLIADVNVMRHMDVGHQQVAVADRGLQAAGLGSAMNRSELADGVAVADACMGRFAAIFQVLRSHAHGRIRKKDILFADDQRAFQDNVSLNFGPRADLDVGTNNRVRTDF